MEEFRYKKLTDNIISIADVTNVFMYLVLGKEEAILIDTGTGAGDLYGFVKTLTDLPVTVILTHGHCDHAGGAKYFEKVYLPKEDFELVKVHASMERKCEYIRFSGGEGFPYEKIVGERTDRYVELKDNTVFDLGNEVLRTIKVPGHTRGMTCILFEKQRILMMGDACNPATFIWDNESLPVQEYSESIRKLEKFDKDYDRVLLSHGEEFCDKRILNGVMEVCRDVMNGEDDAVPYHFMDYEGLRMAKLIDPNTFKREDGGIGNIIYNKDKIFS